MNLLTQCGFVCEVYQVLLRQPNASVWLALVNVVNMWVHY